MTLHHDPSATTESQCQQYQSAVNLCQAILLYSPTNVVTLNNEVSELSSVVNLWSLMVTLKLSRPVRDQLGHLKVTTGMLWPLWTIMNMNLSVSEPYFVSQLSQPPNITQKWFSIQNLHMNLCFQKKRFRNLSLGSRDIKQIQKFNFF